MFLYIFCLKLNKLYKFIVIYLLILCKTFYLKENFCYLKNYFKKHKKIFKTLIKFVKNCSVYDKTFLVKYIIQVNETVGCSFFVILRNNKQNIFQ